MIPSKSMLAVWLTGVAVSGAANASPFDANPTPEIMAEKPIYSPYVNRDYPDQVFFGDTHFHTELSFDAGLVGTTLDVDDAYRFARGEKVISNSGQPVQLVRPLDFLVITDHAEFIGLHRSTAGSGRPTRAPSSRRSRHPRAG